tara:strand:+ start:262 stop:450 length:189 start_codon:yes stop_codon:yes gene_type:complete
MELPDNDRKVLIYAHEIGRPDMYDWMFDSYDSDIDSWLQADAWGYVVLHWQELPDIPADLGG